MFSTKPLILLLTLYGVIGTKKFRSDYTYHRTVDGWLKYHDVPGTWHDARERCYMEGAGLVSPFNENMESALRSEMNKSSVECAGIYIGVHSIFSKGYFSSLEGLPLSKMPVQWKPGEPDNTGNTEDCIAYTNGRVADVNCSEVLPFVCYKQSTADMSVSPCGTIDKEYEYIEKTGSCYKYHTKRQAWAEAYKICSAEGGYLAIINSNEEASALKDILHKLFPTTSNTIRYIGFYNWNKDDVWRTVHGQTLKEAGYVEWRKDFPNYENPGECCGAIFPDGKLANFGCDQRTGFVCEKNPLSLQD